MTMNMGQGQSESSRPIKFASIVHSEFVEADTKMKSASQDEPTNQFNGTMLVPSTKYKRMIRLIFNNDDVAFESSDGINLIETQICRPGRTFGRNDGMLSWVHSLRDS